MKLPSKAILATILSVSFAASSFAFANDPTCTIKHLKPFIAASGKPSGMMIQADGKTYHYNEATDEFEDIPATVDETGNCVWPKMKLTLSGRTFGSIDLQEYHAVKAPKDYDHNNLFITVGQSTAAKPFTCKGAIVAQTPVSDSTIQKMYFCVDGDS